MVASRIEWRRLREYLRPRSVRFVFGVESFVRKAGVFACCLISDSFFILCIAVYIVPPPSTLVPELTLRTWYCTSTIFPIVLLNAS